MRPPLRFVYFLISIHVTSLGIADSNDFPFIKRTPFESARTVRPLKDSCEASLKALPGEFDHVKTSKVCAKAEAFEGCRSVQGQTIFHFDAISSSKNAKKVLVIGVIHGDEAEGGSVARRWMERLSDINARNSWRIIPIANPDGWHIKTRTNSNGVDLNRNFPSQDWDDLAHKYWKEKKGRDPRRNPGPSAGSEPETMCVMRHLEDFKPDFVVAVHTPYGVLDFDGPKISVPRFKWLPWVSLGTFPGSLGRYMWKDRQVPVLTVELKDASILEKMDEVDFLQDIAGTVAIQAGKTISSSLTSQANSKKGEYKRSSN